MAGSGVAGFTDAIGTAAKFYYPRGICIDVYGNLYVADANNYKIRKITPSGNVTSFVEMLFTLSVSGICMNSAGNIFAASSNFNKIYLIEICNINTTASISYSGSPFCKTLVSVPATLSGTGAFLSGTYTSDAGLSINAVTGIINPGLSTAGTYTVTYTIPASGGCPEVITTTSVVILPSPTASISADGVVATNTTINNGNVVQLQLNGSIGTSLANYHSIILEF